MSRRRSIMVMLGGGKAVSTATVTITNGGAELTDYPIRVDVSYSADMDAGLTNIRFKSGATILSHWRESAVASTSAIYWVKVPTVAAAGDTVLTMEYGGVPDGSNGANVFDLFDDFSTALELQADNAATVSIATAGYFENIVYDSVTAKYWWIFSNGSSQIQIAYCDDIASPSWTIQEEVLVASGSNPHLVQFGSTWYIYYGNLAKGVSLVKSSSVNTGYSADGISNPILSVGEAGSWDANRVWEPYVFQIDSLYYMFFMGGDVSGTDELEKTGYATASDPLGPWTKYAGNPVLSGDTGWWDGGNDKAADPFVFEKDGIYYVGVTASSAGKTAWRIGFYKTTDFITFTPIVNNPILGHGGGWDTTFTLRGGISKFGSVYYFPYTGAAGGGLTTLNFNTIGLNRKNWDVITNDYVISGGSLQLPNTTSYVKSGPYQKFGPNYAIRAKTQTRSSGYSYLGFGIGSEGTDFMEIIGCYPTVNDLRGYIHVTADANTGDIGTPGATNIFDLIRNGAISATFSIDGIENTLTTQLTQDNIHVVLRGLVATDWILVRKYVNPEPTVVIS